MDQRADRMKTLIGKVLIAGVAVAGMLVAAGGALYLLHYGSAPVHYHVFRGEPTDFRTISGVLHEAATFSGRGLIQLGLIVLVALQVVRVALTAWLFLELRDAAFVLVSLLVLGVLVFSLFG